MHVSAHWARHAGDANTLGWVVFALYVLGALLSFRRAAGGGAPGERRVWGGLALLCVALGVNKQLDLHAALILLGRVALRGAGLDALKRPLQVGLVLALAGGLAWSARPLARAVRTATLQLRCALAGAGATLLFVLLRAARFQHVYVNFLTGVRGERLLELLGVSMVVVAGAWPARADARTAA